MLGSPTKSDEISDVFIAHASEDKEAVARPLSKALLSVGWTVWLDELKLTVGDSLSRRIDAALARARFGIVVLSPAFFAKDWPQRELAGLAAREIDTGSKVILPVWHNVDHGYIVQRSPVLADRLGALTSAGIERVAEEISLALKESGVNQGAQSTSPASLDATINSDSEGSTALLPIPATPDEQSRVSTEQPPWWEYRLYAGALMQGRIELESKWIDHELRLPSSTRREPDSESVLAFLSREVGWVRHQMLIFERIFDPETFEKAFGAPGEPGDAVLIKRLARGVIQIYEGMMDWAASVRSTSVPEEYEEILELYARLVDGPIRQMHEFIQLVADQVARFPTLEKEAEEKGATKESPMTVTMTLTLSLDDDVQRQLHEALDRLH